MTTTRISTDQTSSPQVELAHTNKVNPEKKQDGAQRTHSPVHFGHREKSHGPQNHSASRKPASHGSAERSQNSNRRGKHTGGKHMRRDIQTNQRLVKKADDNLPAIEKGVIRIIPLGGVEEIGKNMTLIEYEDDIIVIDAGFQFKEEDTPGIDYIIPNTKYLNERKHKIRGLFITHGHLDHIGAIPYVIEQMGNPPIYTRQFGSIMILKRQEEFPHLAALDMRVLDGNETVTIGKNFKVKSFPISHTIPDSMGLVVRTPVGNIAFIEDVRVDNAAGVPTEEEEEQYKQFKDEKFLLLTMDSTSIEKQGFSLSESTVVKNIEKIIKEVKGRLIIGTFASQVERIISIIEIADRYGKKVAVEGRSMKTNVEIIKQLNLLRSNNLIPLEDLSNYPSDKIVMIVTGAQGEEFAALMRIANKSHKQVALNKNDTVLLSSSIIPGNEYAITKLKDNLYRQEARIITYLDSDVHASGHGNRGELEWIHRQISYKFFMPVHGYHHMLRQHAELAQSIGTPKENIVIPDNGSIIEIYDEGKEIRILKEKAPSNVMMVDGFAIGDIQEVVIRDRKMLAEDGMFVIVASINAKTGKLKKSPDIISRGFVYLRESQELLQQTRLIIKKTVEDTTKGMNPINFDYVKNEITDNVTRFLFQKTAKRPLVIPVVLGI
ncbi:MAG: ribonuclease J [Parcubacteria group bacterium]|nr:ribonuclease J [Parcubacteria group bacterium]